MSAEGTLDLIDGALRDYELSSDAMRWTPDETARDDGWSQMQGMTPSLVIFDECAAAFSTTMQAAGQALRTLVGGFQLFTEALGAVEFPPSHIACAILRPRQHVRCHDCNPIANPRPLAINGAAYRRRQKARRRR